MITKGDEYPIHQTSEPIAYAGTDRNFYDRYFFNGYAKKGDVFFSMAMGIYPHLNIKDAAFCIVLDGVQYNLRASAILGMERMDTNVGPIAVEVVEPLNVIRITVADNDHGISADLTFTNNSVIIEEPRFTYREGPRTMMDITRMTQNGSWEGHLTLESKSIAVSGDNFVGTRDRSWGVRPIGAADPQRKVPQPDLQMFWYWAPINFGDHVTMFGLNEDAHGVRWHKNAILIPCEKSAEPVHFPDVDVTYNFKSGTRFQNNMTLRYEGRGQGALEIKMKSRYLFHMSGLGYGHPDWGHGCYRGELDVEFDRYALEDVDPTHPLYFHVQAVVDAEMQFKDETYYGVGVLEQMVFGRHEPSGFQGSRDMAP